MPKSKQDLRPNTGDPVRPNRAARRHYVKVAEAADYLQVTDRTIREMMADGRLTAYRCGSRFVRLDLDEIDAAMIPSK